MNLTQLYVKSVMVRDYIAPGFQRGGFKTEGRLLTSQSGELMKLLEKAAAELSETEPSFVLAMSVLSGNPVPPDYKQARQERGKILAKVGAVDNTLKKTLKKSLLNMYRVTLKDEKGWERGKAVSGMMAALNNVSKKAAKEMLSAKK